MNKYRAKKIYYSQSKNRIYHQPAKGAIRFDSIFEFNVYHRLLKLADVAHIELQPKLCIKPATEAYPALYWKCDFRIHHHTAKSISIEAKGVPTAQFKRDLQYLEFFSPQHYNQLLVVSHQSQRIDQHIQAITLDQMTEALIAIGYSQNN